MVNQGAAGRRGVSGRLTRKKGGEPWLSSAQNMDEDDGGVLWLHKNQARRGESALREQQWWWCALPSVLA
jgi:hypothetical protein